MASTHPARRVASVYRALAADSARSAANGAKKRVVIVGMTQEVAHQNPVPSSSEDFDISRGADLLAFGKHTYIGGAVSVLCARPDVDIVPVYAAGGPSAGVLEHESFLEMSGELLDGIRAAQVEGAIDAVYFSMHGAMATSEEHDPEGYLLECVREIVGADIPVTISVDLHGIMTAKMLIHTDGLCPLHTYPHIDSGDAGARAARLLLQMLDGTVAATKNLRISIPLLCRGNEMITEPHAAGADSYIGEVMRQAVSLEREDTAVLAAGVYWGNPFTDVPELGSQVIVTYDTTAPAGTEERLTERVTALAQQMWDGREIMQAALISPAKAVEHAIGRLGEVCENNVKGCGKGTIVFSDAADATTSGASGNSNQLLRALVDGGYTGSVLFPIVDPDAVETAKRIGEGSSGKISFGGLDPRYTPLALEVTVESYKRGVPLMAKGAVGEIATQDMCVLRHGKIVIAAFGRTTAFNERWHFDDNGLTPEEFDVVVIKTPHAQPEMFDEWCLVNLNVDAEGSTTANVRKLADPTDSTPEWTVRGHSLMKRPCYPLEGSARSGSGETVGMLGGRGHQTAGQVRILGEDFNWSPTGKAENY